MAHRRNVPLPGLTRLGCRGTRDRAEPGSGPGIRAANAHEALTTPPAVRIARFSLPTAPWQRLPCSGAVSLSLARTDDLPAVDAIAQRCHGAGGYGERINAASLRAWTAPTSARYRELWLAREPGGAPVGAACLVGTGARSPTRWSIPYLLIVPAARRQGVATALVREVLRAAAAAGAVHLEVETSAAWGPATSFWRSVLARLSE